MGNNTALKSDLLAEEKAASACYCTNKQRNPVNLHW